MFSAGRVLTMPKGDYDASATYELLDMVFYEGSSYVAKQTTTGNLPTNTTYWQIVAYGGTSASLAGNFATLEATDYASKPYVVGELLVNKDSEFCRVTQDILLSQEIIVGTNVETITVEELINEIMAYIGSLDSVNEKLIGQTPISSQTDLNVMVTPGEYFKESTSFYVTNAPVGIDGVLTAKFRLTVSASRGNASLTNNSVVQTIVAVDGSTYKRGYDGSTWSTWVQFASKSTVDGINTRLTTAESDIDNAETAITNLENSRLNTYASDATEWDSTPTASSNKPVTSGGIKTALDTKQPTYAAGASSWDTAPTASSTKPVTSGGVKTALDNKENKYTVLTQTLAAGATQVTFTNAAITATADVWIRTNKPGLNWTNVTDSVGTCTITYPAQSSPTSVKLIIRG